MKTLPPYIARSERELSFRRGLIVQIINVAMGAVILGLGIGYGFIPAVIFGGLYLALAVGLSIYFYRSIQRIHDREARAFKRR